MNSFYVNNRPPLMPSEFCFLPLGSVRPSGWLKRQLRIQAEGQSGKLPDFWDSLGPNSGWRGGTGESWERGPYYLDGLVPLAYLLEDDELKAKAQEWIEWTLNSQDVYGLFGPMRGNVDWWPLSVMLKVLAQYHEVTGDARVIPFMERFFRYMKNQLPVNHMHSWAVMRWTEMALCIIWLYNRTGDPELLDLLKMVREQGYDWSWHFREFALTSKQTGRFRMISHVVNNAMGVKGAALQYVLSGWPEHRAASDTTLAMLDEYHGCATGIFTGDEHLAGKDPTQGTELCAVVEYMFSLENMIQILGSPAYGDRLEMIAYNALPGTFSADMMAHQYDQQANQVLCTIAPRHWTNNSPDSNIFGLEPQYGCCTSNFHQGWPKLAANLWMATPDEGLAAVAFAPCQVGAKVRGGVEVTIDVETGYPFDETVTFRVRTPVPVTFPLRYRVPGWAEGASAKLNNGECACGLTPGTFHTAEREWRDGDTLEVTFPMKVRAERRFNGAVTLKRGPLVYSLKIGERWERIRGIDECPDYAVYPTTPWNYGLLVDPENPEAEVVVKGVGDVIYSPDSAPIELRVKGRRIPGWDLVDEQAGPLPVSPVSSSEPVEELTLIPYGCAKLRITEFPLLEG